MAVFSQTHGIVPVHVPIADDYNAGFTMDSINMGKYNHCTLIITGSDSCAGAGVLSINCATTDGGTTTKASFKYRISAADAASAGADTLGALTAVAAGTDLTFVEASIKSGMYIIEINASDLNVSGVQYQFITPILSAAGTAGIINAVAILSEPRYAQAIMPTAIPA